jgi:hypothetical protein
VQSMAPSIGYRDYLMPDLAILVGCRALAELGNLVGFSGGPAKDPTFPEVGAGYVWRLDCRST